MHDPHVKRKRILALAMVAAAIGAALVLALEFGYPLGIFSTHGQPTTSRSTTVARSLPEGCSEPSGGYLIIASNDGFNDSILHGAPQRPWPIIRVHKGDSVNIVVCNTDIQAHGFQIRHYFDSNIETVEPGQVIHVSFTASEAGTFEIYCSIFCTIHIYMQNAQLIVSG